MRYIICKYFLPFHRMSFHFLIISFDVQSLNFNKFFSIFFFCYSCFDFLRIHCQIQSQEDYLFSPKCFNIIFSFLFHTIRPYIKRPLYMIKVGVQVLSFTCDYPVVPVPSVFSKRLHTFVENQLAIDVWVFSWLSILFHWSVWLSLWQYHIWLLQPYVKFWNWEVSTSALFFFFSIVLAIWGPLDPFVFEGWFFHFAVKTTDILIGIRLICESLWRILLS